MHEIFDLHLLELARAEDEVARGYFITESFSLLRYTEWHVRVQRVYDIAEIRENSLRRLGPQITLRVSVVNHQAVVVILFFDVKFSNLCAGLVFHHNLAR